MFAVVSILLWPSRVDATFIGTFCSARTVQKVCLSLWNVTGEIPSSTCSFLNFSKVVNSRLGWYRRCGMNVVNYILNPKLLETKIKNRPALVNPLNYYLRKVGI